ncbi:DUF3363 domain-containing protein [Brevundimonas sp.]|uniref:DUF3363 domain-containing protein n=1 Tax=Brevundimonas sp. TaxID=1871086 RepID=UPI0025BF97BD|nr:DUF3363 domain-containing protein [Brevundimonas sp.]
MTEPREPDDHHFKPPMTARRETPRAGTWGRLLNRATPSMTPRARARHFNAKGSVQRVRPVRSAAGGMRRVMVKVRVVPMTGASKRALTFHLRYVERDGAGAEGERGEIFDAQSDAADTKSFVERTDGDRHHFRLIMNPEDGRDLPDLKAFTRDFMNRLEEDLGTPLDWVAGAHYDTGRPHLHIVLRGKRDDGQDLVIPRDYVSHGMRQRSQELATEILGPRQDRGVSERDVTADRFTPMDRTLVAQVREGSLILGGLPEDQRSDALRRLVHLEARGWAQRVKPGLWSVPSHLRDTLHKVGEREGREAAATRAVWGGRWGGEIERLQPLEIGAGETVVGAYAGVRPIGFYGNGPQALVMETMDGRLGHVRLPSLDSALILDRVPERAIVSVTGKARPERASDRTIAEIAQERGGTYSTHDHHLARPDDSPAFIERHVRRLEAMSREGACRALGDGRFAISADYVAKASLADQARHGAVDLEVKVLDVRPLEQQPQAWGITWLDDVMSDRAKAPTSPALAAEVRELGRQRAETLKGWGIGSGEPSGLGKDETRKLLGMDLNGQMKRLGQDGKLVQIAQEGKAFSGTYVDRGHINGQTYAVIGGKGVVTLAPWRPALEACRDQAMIGVLQGGLVDFQFGPQRGRGLGLEL